MLNLDVKTLNVVILVGYLVSGIIFFLYAYAFKKRNLIFILYAIGKVIQFFAWTFYAFYSQDLTANRMVIGGFLITTSCAIEVFCILQISEKNFKKLATQLSAIAVLGSLIYIPFSNDIIMRVLIMSVTVALIYSYLFVLFILKPKNLKMLKVIGWFAFLIVIINLGRGLSSYLSNTELPLYSNSPIQILTGFMWILASLALPILYVLAINEKDAIKLNNYQRNLEKKVNKRTKKLKESLQREKELGVLKTNFVSMASHEFRTPLAAIKATTEVLQRYSSKLNKGQIDERLNKIKSEVDDMTQMLEEILIIGKSDIQKLEFNPVQFNLVKKIKTIISEYQLGQNEDRNILFNNPDEEIIVNADPKWIKHIVINLLSNAIKYSESDKPVEINVMSKENEITFSFKDYGIGISKADIKQLFEPFHRGENVGHISGTGLGMVVTHRAVKLHGGTIDVQSEIDKGSTFTVRLPQ